jgi:two-component system, OmpR family, sensor histidine kinase CiaH
MFHKAAFKLAALYLLIIMGISFFFSANVYQLSIQELDRGIRKQDLGRVFFNDPLAGPSTRTVLPLLQAEQEQSYNAARNHVLNRLMLINLFILIGGGILSYYLALRTLRPIEEAHEAQSRFVADASHELRTPIAAMRTETEVALMDPKLTLPEAKAKLHSNLEELERLTALSEGLLRLAQLENNELPKETVSVVTIMQKAVDQVLPLAEQKNILINTKADDTLAVKGDEASLVEALVILLDNAVKYSPKQSEIVMRGIKHQRGIVIQIKDSGTGIKATELPHIFDRFYRADTARSKQHVNGYGIGLAIAKNIVELHGGKISVQSHPGKGSTFEIHLSI